MIEGSQVLWLSEPKLSEHSKPIRTGKKGVKNDVQKNQLECSNSSDSEYNEIGLVVCQILLAVDSSKADSWIVNSGVTRHIYNDRRSFVEIHTLNKP